MLPKGIGVLPGFTPEEAPRTSSGSTNYITFVIQISLFFGIGFILPVLVVAAQRRSA